MKKYLFFGFILFTQIAFSQSDFQQRMVSVNSLLDEKKYEEAISPLDSLINESIALAQWDNAIIAIKGRGNYKLFKDLNQAIAFLENEKTQLVLYKLPEIDLGRANLYVQKAYYFGGLNDYASALQWYDNALSIYSKLELLGKPTAYAYRRAAQIALRLIDYEKTDSYLHSALKADTSGYYHVNIYSFLAQSSNYQVQYSDAINYYEKGIQLDGKIVDVFRLNGEAAIAYAHLKNATAAKSLLSKNLEILKREGPRFQAKEADGYYQDAGRVYGLLDEPQLAKELFQKGINEALKSAKGKKNREIAKLYVRLGDWFFKQKDYLNALDAFHAGMQQAFPDFNNDDVLSNPSLDQIGRESFMMTTAKRKGETYLELYKIDKNSKWLKPAETCFDLTFSGASNLRTTFSDEDAKFHLEHFNAKSLEKALQTCYLLWTLSEDSTYVQKGYRFTEQHKSLVLRDAIIKNRSLVDLGVPDSILQREVSLRKQVLDLKLKVKNNTGDKDQLKIQLGAAQSNYDFLLADLKKAYPEFAKRIQQQTHVDISEIQSQLLNEHTSLLQFHWGDEMVFVFQIEKNQYHWYQLFRKDLDPALKPFLQLLPDRNAQENAPTQYFDKAYLLYQQLLETVLAKANPTIDKLIIVPDGMLSFLPFEVLLSQAWTGSFEQAPYLLNLFDFQYAYSPTLILQKKNKKRKLSGVLAVAPVFENQPRGLASLVESKTEIKNIGLPRLKKLVGEDAKLSAFLEELKNKQVLHLSTHAQSNTDKLPPRIEFIDTSLSLQQLYTMQIPAELVILSACESSLGAYAIGEGVMSLSRGFAHAGAESMIASLWAVNEKSTVQLFSNYYQQLQQKSKATALRSAKQDYISNTEVRDRYKAPYYWAGFVFTGKEGMIKIRTSFWDQPLSLGLVILSLLVLLFYFLRR